MISLLILAAATSVGPKIDPSSLILIDPPESLLAREEGKVGVAVEISKRGKPETCTVTVNSGFPRLDEQTCRLVQKARFQPARNDEGKSIAATYRTKLEWKIRS